LNLDVELFLHVLGQDVTIFKCPDCTHGIDDSGIHTRADGFLAQVLQPPLFGDFLNGIGVLCGPSDIEDLVVVEGLAGHGLFCELGVDFVDVGDEGDAAVLKDTDALDGAPFFEMPHDGFLCLLSVSGLFYPANVEGAILPVEASDATHVVSVIGELVSSETVLGAVGQGRGRVWESVEVFAFPAVGTAAAREEETGVLDSGRVGAGETGVAFDVAACLGFYFAKKTGERREPYSDGERYFE